jgi:hypothetical protein
VVAFKVNCFGHRDWDNLLQCAAKLSEKYYSRYLFMEKKVRWGTDFDMRYGKNYSWNVSSFFQELSVYKNGLPSPVARLHNMRPFGQPNNWENSKGDYPSSDEDGLL